MGNLNRNDTNNLIYKTETDTDLQNKLMVVREREGWGMEQLGTLGRSCTHCYI